MINIVDVTHHYGVKPVLRQVNLRVPSGTITALMGPNGMGKSTLMSVVAGLLSPLQGYVEIDSKRRRSTPDIELAIRQQVVYAPADQWVPPGKTAREWMIAVGQIYGVDDDRLMDHVDQLLDLFELKDHGDTQISSCSTGQRKKIALCCALVAEAKVMLLDEPFAGGLDPSGILALKRLLQHRARNEGVTILLATPVPELVAEIADQIAIVQAGRIIAADSLDGLRQTTGMTGPLDDIYAQLVAPRMSANIERYFAERRK